MECILFTKCQRVSLNGVLLKVPDFYPNLIGVLLHFRRRHLVFRFFLPKGRRSAISYLLVEATADLSNNASNIYQSSNIWWCLLTKFLPLRCTEDVRCQSVIWWSPLQDTAQHVRWQLSSFFWLWRHQHSRSSLNQWTLPTIPSTQKKRKAGIGSRFGLVLRGKNVEKLIRQSNSHFQLQV